MATKEIYPTSKNDIDSTIDVWMGLFGKKDDGLMATALQLCYLKCKFFPSPADISEAIQDLVYEETTKPKMIAWEVKREPDIAEKVMDFVRQDKAKEYMQSLDISKMVAYARIFFPAISEELVLKNYNEFSDGMKSQEMCFACRTAKQACGGCIVKHELSPKGWITNLVARCEKNDRR